MDRATIKDVAKEAGVSIGTVSNALNGGRYISTDTREKVINAVKKLNYIPNLNGRYLKTGASKTIGFFTNTVTGAYFGTLLDAMSRQCDKLGYQLNIFITKDPAVIMTNIMGRCFDGVIIYEGPFLKSQEIAMIQNVGVKMVFLDRELAGKGMSSILFNSYQAGYEATKYLIRLGHKKIGFIEYADDILDSKNRKAGYQAALEENHLPAGVILQGNFEEEYCFNGIINLIHFHVDLLPDAFLAGNDLSAVGCINALNVEGYQVPDDISVIGFDDIDIAQYYKPSLTTVKNPIARQGVLAVDTLVALIEEKEEGSIKQLEGRLIVRESCVVKY